MTNNKAHNIIAHIKQTEQKVADSLIQAKKDRDRKMREVRKEVQEDYAEYEKSLKKDLHSSMEFANEKLDKKIEDMGKEGLRKKEELIEASRKKMAASVKKIMQRIEE